MSWLALLADEGFGVGYFKFTNCTIQLQRYLLHDNCAKKIKVCRALLNPKNLVGSLLKASRNYHYLTWEFSGNNPLKDSCPIG